MFCFRCHSSFFFFFSTFPFHHLHHHHDLSTSVELGRKWDADLSLGKEAHPFLQRRSAESMMTDDSPLSKLPEKSHSVLPTWDPPFPLLELGNCHVRQSEENEREDPPSHQLLLKKKTPKATPGMPEAKDDGRLLDLSMMMTLTSSIPPPAAKLQTYLSGEDVISFVDLVYPLAKTRFPKVSSLHLFPPF